MDRDKTRGVGRFHAGDVTAPTCRHAPTSDRRTAAREPLIRLLVRIAPAGYFLTAD